MLSDFGLMFFISDVFSVTNEIIAVEKIASKPMSLLKMTSVPAVHLDCKVVGRFQVGFELATWLWTYKRLMWDLIF